MKILIAEDESVSRRMLKRTLEGWGYEVTAAKNGQEALEAFEKNRFAIVITDWMMPVMDGLELVKKIRNYASNDYVYIMMLTARSEKEDLINGMDSGADDFVAKPFDRDELRVRLRAGQRLIQLEMELSKRNTELQAVNERMRMDLLAAADIQAALLPPHPPDSDRVEIAWNFKPCDELAGDILNVFKLDEENLAFYVLDVSGHGVSAALLAVSLSRMLSPIPDQASLLKNPAGNNPGYKINDPAEVAQKLNKRFQVDENHGQFFTMIYGILNTNSLKFRYVSCGHPPLIHAPAGKAAKARKVASMPIGFSETTQYKAREIQLAPGDRVYLFSDGLPEARDEKFRQFGVKKIVSAISRSADAVLTDSLSSLLETVEAWSHPGKIDDDVTLLGFRILH